MTLSPKHALRHRFHWGNELELQHQQGNSGHPCKGTLVGSGWTVQEDSNSHLRIFQWAFFDQQSCSTFPLCNCNIQKLQLVL